MLPQCWWGATTHQRDRCPLDGTCTFEDSRLSYCPKHFEIVEKNREWLRRYVQEKREATAD
jgi:hypothetical protein